MTTAEWLAADDPEPMLAAVRAPASGRKLRLFAVGCCRLAWNPFAGSDTARALWAAEELADGRAGDSDPWVPPAGDGGFVAPAGYLRHVARAVDFARLPDPVAAAGQASASAALAAADIAGLGQPARHQEGHAEYRVERRTQAALLRCVLGHPFRRPVFDPRWRTVDVVALARGIYDDRAFRRLPILADALMDAGCDREDVIAHCRSAGPHARGCWVVDLVLGQE